MSEWAVALIAAGSAVAGSAVTGWFTRSAGVRQADAAKHAGDRQADALLRTVQDTLDEQRRARVEERRRQVYGEFLAAAQDAASHREDRSLAVTLQKAFAQVHVEGPGRVTMAGVAYMREIQRWRREGTDSDSVAREATEYLDAVRTALGIQAPPDPDRP